MTRSSLISFILFAAVACSESPSAPQPARPDAVRGPSLAASTETISTSVPTDLVVFVSCANGGAGELVELSGNLHILTSLTTTPNGKVTVRSLFQPQGISGTGMITGTKYQATGGTQETVVASDPLPFVDTFVNNFRIIGAGPGNNYLVHETVHVTINAGGEVTAEVDKLSVECR